MIAEGTYRACAEPDRVFWGKAPSNNEQVSVPFRIKSDCQERGQSIFWIRVFTSDQKNVDITCEGLEAAGWDGVSLRELNGLGSRDVEIVVYHDTYEGKTRPKIRYVNTLNRSPFKVELTDKGLSDLDARVARMRGKGPTRREESPPAGDQGGGYGGGEEWDGQGVDPNSDDPGF